MSLSKQSLDRLNRLQNLPEEAIDFSDLPELDEAFWQHAKITLPNRKKGIYLKIDEDVVSWFKAQGKGYQARINAVLKAYKQSQLTS